MPLEVKEMDPIKRFLAKASKKMERWNLTEIDIPKDNEDMIMDEKRIFAISDGHSKFLARLMDEFILKTSHFEIDYLIEILKTFKKDGMESIKLSIGEDTPLIITDEEIFCFLSPRVFEEDGE